MSTHVTMRDVAKEAGVSPMTVSRALKSDGAVNEKTRKAVQEAAARLGYVYDLTAQTFRSQRSGFVALTLPSINNANFATTHKALTQSLADTDLQLLLGITNYDIDQEERILGQLLARRPDAVIVTGGTHTDQTRRLLGSIAIPVFEIWDVPATPIGHVVGFSNFDAMGLIVKHLADQGRSKLGFVGASPDTDTRGNERRLGAHAAARELGLQEVVDIQTGPAPATMTASARAIEQHRDKLDQLDALICVSDPVAFGAISALEGMGLRVPQDIAVSGFGNFEISQISRPTITTVEVGAAEIGKMIGAKVVEALGANEPDTMHRLCLEPSLAVRESTV